MIGACKSIRYWQQNDGACCKTDEFEIGKLNQLNFKYDIASISMYHSRYRSLYLRTHAKHVAMHSGRHQTNPQNVLYLFVLVH